MRWCWISPIERRYAVMPRLLQDAPAVEANWLNQKGPQWRIAQVHLKRWYIGIYTHSYTHIHTHIHVYTCVHRATLRIQISCGYCYRIGILKLWVLNQKITHYTIKKKLIICIVGSAWEILISKLVLLFLLHVYHRISIHLCAFNVWNMDKYFQNTVIQQCLDRV